MIKEFTIVVNEKQYLVKVEKRKMKNITLKYADNCFYLHVNSSFYSKKYLEQIVLKHSKNLIKSAKGKVYMQNSKVFLFGNLVDANNIQVDNIVFRASNIDYFYSKVMPYFLKYITERTRYYEKIMNIPIEHKINVGFYKSLYGVNYFKKEIIRYNVVLIHFSKEVIDSVVVHELAHYFVHSHNKEFYGIINLYLPNYNEMRKCLVKGLNYDSAN